VTVKSKQRATKAKRIAETTPLLTTPLATTPLATAPGIVTNTPGILKPKTGKTGKTGNGVVALSLSGGAAHGDFEVGVVKYLYLRRSVVPKIICGTSVGSINALKLAEGEPANGSATPDKDGHVQGLAGLEQIWRSLRVDDDMYNTVNPVAKLLGDLKSAAMAAGEGALIGGSFLGPLGLIGGALIGGGGDVSTLVADVKKLMGTRSLGNLDPLISLMQKPSSFKASFVAASKIEMRLIMTALEDGKLRMVNEHGHLLERDGSLTPGKQPYDAAGKKILARIAAIEQQITDIQEDATNPKLGPVEKPNVAAINQLRAQENTLRAQLAGHLLPAQPVEVGLIEAALASSSLPVFFPPQGLGDGRYYVDGGTRMVTPIEPAWKAGATQIYAVVASQNRMSPGTDPISSSTLSSYAPPANIVDIGLRVGADIEPSEINDDQLYPPSGWPVNVIVFRPAIDIHDSMTIDPGLIDIRMDQGWMVADDVMQAYDKKPGNYRDLASQYDGERNTTEIATYRHEIWKKEFAANGWIYIEDNTGAPQPPLPLPPVPEALDQAIKIVRQMKQNLQQLVEARIKAGGNVPDGYDQWWTGWERHAWKPLGPLYPPKPMTVSASPNKNVPLNKKTTIKVVAKDQKGKPISGANVLENGTVLGAAGKAITTTFKATETMSVDPKTHAHIPHFTMPALTVAASGYVTTTVPVKFTGTP
jgi:predicted acylesterase/phospholipase RssA